MKQFFIYSVLFVSCLYLGSCKSSQRISKKDNSVSVEDFRPLNQNIVVNSKAVKLSEVVDAHVEPGTLSPWTHNLRSFAWMNCLKWKTEVEDKILFYANNVNGESFCDVLYFNPLGMRWDLMTLHSIWLYTLEKNGRISKRRLKKNEIIRERVNDSICKMRLNIHENVDGKILVRKYSLVSPYYTIQATSLPYFIEVVEPELYKMEPWIFQKDIPLLYGKYEIRLPEDRGANDHFIKSEVVKLGNGKMNVQSKRVSLSLPNPVGITHNGVEVTATVSNVPPLPKGSGEQPLGIEILRNWEE